MLTTELIILCLASLGAGFVDSIVGGGGLIQLPALMMILPQYPVVTILGTNKLVSMTGTAFSAYRFSREIPFNKHLLLPAVISAFLFSFIGAWTVSILSSHFLRPLFMGLMLVVFIFTIKFKSFGLIDHATCCNISVSCKPFPKTETTKEALHLVCWSMAQTHST